MQVNDIPFEKVAHSDAVKVRLCVYLFSYNYYFVIIIIIFFFLAWLPPVWRTAVGAGVGGTHIKRTGRFKGGITYM